MSFSSEVYLRKHAVETDEMLDFLKELVEGVPDPSQGGTIDLEAEAESKRKRGKAKRTKDKDTTTNALPSSSALPSDTEPTAVPAPVPKRSRKSKKAEVPPPAPEGEDYDAEAAAAEPAPKKQKRVRKAPVKEKKTKAKAEAPEKIVAAPPPSSSAMAALPSLAGPSLSMASTPALERDDPMDGTSRRGAVDEDMDDYDDAGRGDMSGSAGEGRPVNRAVESEDEDDWDSRR